VIRYRGAGSTEGICFTEPEFVFSSLSSLLISSIYNFQTRFTGSTGAAKQDTGCPHIRAYPPNPCHPCSLHYDDIQDISKLNYVFDSNTEGQNAIPNT
jgi:hypothetical protein